MDVKRCVAECKNGRRCSNPLNERFVDLCTKHGKYEQKGGVIIRRGGQKLPEKPIFANRFHTDCSICLCPVDEQEIDLGLPCGHDMHLECGKGLRKNECPMCKKEFDVLRNQNAETDAILEAIHARMEEDEEERREANNAASEALARLFENQRRWQREIRRQAEQPAPVLPAPESPEFAIMVGEIYESAYVRNENFQHDHGTFHGYLHARLKTQDCEYIDKIIDLIIQIHAA